MNFSQCKFPCCAYQRRCCGCCGGLEGRAVELPRPKPVPCKVIAMSAVNDCPKGEATPAVHAMNAWATLWGLPR